MKPKIGINFQKKRGTIKYRITESGKLEFEFKKNLKSFDKLVLQIVMHTLETSYPGQINTTKNFKGKTIIQKILGHKRFRPDDLIISIEPKQLENDIIGRYYG